MAYFSQNIILNLKRAHPLIDKRNESRIRAIIREYIENHIEKKQINLNFNKKILIKSIISRIKNNPKNQFFLPKKKNLIFIDKKRKSFDYNNMKSMKSEIIDSNQILRRSSSYNNIKNGKEKLNSKYRIILSKQISDKNIESEKQDYSFVTSFKNNRLLLSANNFQKKNPFKYNFFNSLKENNNNITKNNNHHNILLLKRNSESCKSMNNSNIYDKGSSKSINSRTIKSNKNIQSTIKKKKSEQFMNRNINKIDIYKNEHFIKINKTYFKKQNRKEDYLKFLEKKSLALRANFIMNNIQDSRGGKQQLRALYNPLNV
jgi:hypothetical protein